MLTLIGGAAVLALLLFFAVRNYAVQVAQEGQDNILDASATSMLDAATFRDGVVELDLPYAAFSMLTTSADDQVFYAIRQDGAPGNPRCPSKGLPETLDDDLLLPDQFVDGETMEVVIVLDKMPINATGKVDRAALKKQAAERVSAQHVA